MERKEVLQKVAPCGLICYTCAAASDGAIQVHSRALLSLLEGFDGFAERFSAHEPRLKAYPYFREVLGLFAEAGCQGCREGDCMYPGCPVWPCIKEKEHDFCFECADFPCDEADFDPALREKWMSANERMREIGPEAYLQEVKEESHYAQHDRTQTTTL
jgi:hypothetical protein